MKRWATLSSALTLALAVSACGGDTESENSAAGKPDNAAVGTAGSSSANTANAGTMAQDRRFVQQQLAMGEHEIALGQLAQKKGSHAEVKRFGEMMVRDHRMAGQELKELSSKMATGTSGTNTAENQSDGREDHQESMEELQKLSGREFDRQYIDQMVEDHEKAVNDLERMSGNGSTEVRQWASKTLPKVQQHLEQARTIKETLSQAGSGERR